MAGVVLFAGWFLVPLLLLWLGQRLRDASAARRRLFWGGVCGYLAGIAVSLLAFHTPPVLWTGGLREWLAFGGTLAAPVLGMLIGVGTMKRR